MKVKAIDYYFTKKDAASIRVHMDTTQDETDMIIEALDLYSTKKTKSFSSRAHACDMIRQINDAIRHAEEQRVDDESD